MLDWERGLDLLFLLQSNAQLFQACIALLTPNQKETLEVVLRGGV